MKNLTSIVLIVLMLLILAGVQQVMAATYQGQDKTTNLVIQQDTKTLLSSQYGKLGEILGFGDRLYLINGQAVLVRGSIFSPASIVSVQAATYVSTADIPQIPVTLHGIAKSIDTQTSHRHTLDVYDFNTGTLVKSQTFNVPSDQDLNVNIVLDKLATGTYVYRIKETVSINTMFEVHQGSAVCSRYIIYSFWTVPAYAGQPSPFTGGLYCNPPGLPNPSTQPALTKMGADIGAVVGGNEKTFTVTSSAVAIATNPPAPTVQATAIGSTPVPTAVPTPVPTPVQTQATTPVPTMVQTPVPTPILTPVQTVGIAATLLPASQSTQAPTQSDIYEIYNGYTIKKIGNTFYVDEEPFNSILAAHSAIDAVRAAPRSQPTAISTPAPTMTPVNDNGSNNKTSLIIAVIFAVVVIVVAIIYAPARKGKGK